MGNLTKYKAETSKTVAAIYDWHKRRGDAEKPRKYLGASIAGHECDRYLWFSFRQCFKPNFDGRMYRLFETGQLEEARFIAELRKIGCEVVDRDEDGEQIGIEDIGGHFRGHLDGVGHNIPEAPETWHVLEFKTFGGSENETKDFEKVKSMGVKIGKPVHYAQFQIYMGKTELTRTLYLCKKKATDELYSERIKYDKDFYKSIMARMRRIIESIELPDRCSKRSDDYRCGYCDARDICWGCESPCVPLPSITCRTCCHATPETDMDGGTWTCNKSGKKEVLDDTDNPCEYHLLIPGLVVGCEPVDAGDDWIEFENPDGQRWRHGIGDPTYSTTQDLTTKSKPEEE